MIGARGDVARIAFFDLAGQSRIGVPDAQPAPVLVGGAFDLIVRSGDAPGETGRGFGGSGAGVHGVDLIMDRVLPMQRTPHRRTLTGMIKTAVPPVRG